MHAATPDNRRCVDPLTARQRHSRVVDLLDLDIGHHLDAELRQCLLDDRLRSAHRHRDPWRTLDQHDANLALTQALTARGQEVAHTMRQLGGDFHAREA